MIESIEGIGRRERKFKRLLARPYTYISDSTGTASVKMLVLLSVQVLMLFASKSYASLAVLLASSVGSVLANLLCLYAHEGFEIEDHYQIHISVVQGLVTGMLVPETYPPLTVFFVTFFTMLVVKHFFGGYARAWVNPSACVVAILWIVGSRVFPLFDVNFDLLSSRNPSQILIENGVFPIFRYDAAVTEALNGTVFRLFKVSIPEGYVSLFWDSGSSIPAFRFNLLTLASSIVIFSDDLVKSISSAVYLFVYMALVRFLSPVFFGAVEVRGDILLALLTGGTIFCATFVLGWYGTTPSTVAGKTAVGFFAGIASFFISGAGTSPCGMVFTVIAVNIFSVVVQQFESRSDRKRMEKLMKEREKEYGGN